jgi:hypothetical protein
MKTSRVSIWFLELPDLLNVVCTFLHPEEFNDSRLVCRAFSRSRPRWRYLSDSGDFASRSESTSSLMMINQMLKLADVAALRGLHSHRAQRCPTDLSACHGLLELVIDQIDTFKHPEFARSLPHTLVRLSLSGNLSRLNVKALVAKCPNVEELIMEKADFRLCLAGWPRLRRLSVEYAADEVDQCLQFVSAQKRLEQLHPDCWDLSCFSSRFTDAQLNDFSEKAPWHLLPRSLRTLAYDWTPPSTLYKALDGCANFRKLLLTLPGDNVMPDARNVFVDSFCDLKYKFEHGFPFI